MTESIIITGGLSKEEKYISILPQLIALTENESDLIANTSNIFAALKETFFFFWVGIYFVKKTGNTEELIVGPFQGPPACVRIAKGKGVCGTSWQKKEAIVVPDVNNFPGHIACSPFSKSEIVVPVIKKNEVVAVIDIDSDVLNNFDETDVLYISEIAEIISKWI